MRACFIIMAFISQIACGALEFDSNVIEVDAAADALKAKADFRFKNAGNEPVIISHIDPDCDCISIKASGGTKLPDGKIRYRPGESGVIRTIFKIGNDRGIIEEVTAIWLKGDAKDKPSIRLTTRIRIPKIITMTPRSLKWDVGSANKPQSIEVVMDHEQPIRITEAKSSSDKFEIKLETVEEGKRYALWVHPQSTDQPGISVIQVITDSPVKNQKIEQVFAMVMRPE